MPSCFSFVFMIKGLSFKPQLINQVVAETVFFSSAMTFYRFSTWQQWRRNFTSGFGLGDVALL